MEKVMYSVWKPDGVDSEQFRQQLLGPMTEALLASDGLRSLRVSVADRAVAAAEGLRQHNLQGEAGLMDGVISLWLDSAIYRQRQQDIIATAVAAYHGYLVTESEPLCNLQHPPVLGQRVEGMCEVVFLQRPERLSFEQWLDTWHHSHTQIAIDTQSTFGYRQNVVTRSLTDGAPVVDAIIEENFPAAAMTSPEAFYDAVGDEQRFRANQKAMIDSCVRFIDFDRLDVLPTSEYVLI